jgi:hypothetical protein
MNFSPNRGGVVYAASGSMAAIFSYSISGSNPVELCPPRVPIRFANCTFVNSGVIVPVHCKVRRNIEMLCSSIYSALDTNY